MLWLAANFGLRAPLYLFFLLLLFPARHAKAADVTSTLVIGGSKIEVTIDASEAPISEPDVMNWVKSAAQSVAAYYGRFPVPHLTLRVASFDGRGVRHGQTWGRDGGLIRIRAGGQTSPLAFADDWMLTHEMVHLAFPSLPDENHWLEEGLSTYVEPIARIQAGHWTALQMWSDVARDMSKGQPEEGDEGLDHTHTWGRTYWGGALFCFVADVQIRRQTKNKEGLQDALRGILDAGGDIRDDWEIEKALKTGDRSVGVNVLEKLYSEWKDRPVEVDLSVLWKQLGIEHDKEAVSLNDDAPLASIRRAIERGSAKRRAAQADASNDLAALSPKSRTIFAGRRVADRQYRD